MAIRTGNEGVGNWNKKMQFPKQRYTLACIEEEFKVSENSGNPMLIRTYEIVLPETVQIGDKIVNVAGQKVTQYRVVKVKAEDDSWNQKKSDTAWQNFREELANVGVPLEDEMDDENPPCLMKGKTVDAILRANKQVALADPTPEERAQGKKVGQPIKDGMGQDIVEYQIQIDQIIGASSEQIDQVF